MKNIILFICLLAGIEMNAQIVGGFIPLNSTKTPTMGGLKVNGTTITDGLSIGTATLPSGYSIYNSKTMMGASSVYGYFGNGTVANTATTGATYFQSALTTSASSFTIGSAYHFHAAEGTIGASSTVSNQVGFFANSNMVSGINNYGFYGNIPSGSNRWNNYHAGTAQNYFQGSVGIATTTPAQKLHVVGSALITTSLLLGSTPATLTGNSSGAIATMSDVVYSQWLGAAVIGGGSSPSDGTSYYLGNCNAWNASATNVSLTIPYNCTLVGYNAVAFVNGTVGSAESITLAIMGTTNYTLTTTMTYSLGGANSTSTTGISQNFNAGDLFYIRQFSPTWATNPTQIAIGITLYFIRRT